MTINNYILVFGATGGLGSSLVRNLIADGYSVIAIGRNKEKLNILKTELGKDRFHILHWDYKGNESVFELSTIILEEGWKISGIVHAMGIEKTMPLSLFKEQDIDKLLSINVLSAVFITKIFTNKKFISDEGLSIVLFSSLAAHEGAIGKSIYGLTKGALEGFLKPVSAELAQKKIRINCIVSGIVDSGMTIPFFSKLSDEQKEMIIKGYPLGIGKADDISNAVVFLLSGKSSWITGQKIVLDGGYSHL